MEGLVSVTTMKAALVCFSILLVGAFAAPSNDVPSARIIGGIPAERGQIPYQASIQFCLNGNCQHACGGAIIGDEWVLSAAHCVTQAPTLGRYQVVAGLHDLEDFENPETQVVRVSYVLINPEYDGGINPHDLAIFKLAHPLEFGEEVRPIDLPDQDEIFEGPAIISGWGSIGGIDVPEMPAILQFVESEIVPPEACQHALDSILGGQPHPLDIEANVCTGPLTGGVSICTGDNGSPVADIEGQRLIGIASWFVTPCGTIGAPSVHNRISHYSTWIRDSTSF